MWRRVLFALCCAATCVDATSDETCAEPSCGWRPANANLPPNYSTTSFAVNAHSAAECFAAVAAAPQNPIAVQSPLARLADLQAAGDTVFVMLNGANVGVYIQILDPGLAAGCLGTVAHVAAIALEVPRHLLVQRMRFYSPMGQPVNTLEQGPARVLSPLSLFLTLSHFSLSLLSLEISLSSSPSSLSLS
jgi:hypothetical protein